MAQARVVRRVSVGNSATGLADGRQPFDRPFFRAVRCQLSHQQTVRQHHQVHVPRLALAAAKLTVSHAQLLFPVAVKGFRAGPTITIRLENAIDFPTSAVGDEHLGQLFCRDDCARSRRSAPDA